ncbi:MAG TPA: hypothetical protein VNS32_08580 [Flavisolibacter sp.]|nr:hypothetical protein [Flavisolibacter sp.]
MKKLFILALSASCYVQAAAQELYVFTEPASNMPAHTITPKIQTELGSGNGSISQRYTPQMMFGFSKKFMMHLGGTLSNMYTGQLRGESIFTYAKYRFFSDDGVHRHFRMALFGEASLSKNDYQYDELNLQGGRSGIQLGLVATQLVNRFAVSGTWSTLQALDHSRFDKIYYTPERIYQAMNYSLSAGYLLLPKEYQNYKQLNLNLYTELLGQTTWGRKTNYLDLAPAIQFIFNSNTKLNLGYRFQIEGDQYRPSTHSFLLSVEHTLFNALK